MTAMSMIQALNSALDVTMAGDPDVLVFGEDVGYFGGVFRVTDGLQAKHGITRCFDTPISEGGIIATAIGMGAYGLRPVPEIQFADYILAGLRPARLGGRAPALSLGRRILRADHGALALWRRHLRRPDPQPVARGPVRARRGPQDRHPVQPLRRQRAVDRVHRGQ